MSLQDEYPLGTILEFLEKDCDVNKGDFATVVGHTRSGLILNFNRLIQTNSICGWSPSQHRWKIIDKLQVSVSSHSTSPRNNDGRITCFACGAATRKAGGGIYDICTQCGR